MMAILLKSVHCIGIKLTKFVHLDIMHFLYKNHENPIYQLQDMLISISALLWTNMNKKCVAAKLPEPIFHKIQTGLS